MKRKFLYMVNPISGTKIKSVLKDTITKRTLRAKVPFEIISTRRDGDYAELRNYVISEKITDIIVCGGDGSVSTIVSHLLNLDIDVGIIPMGSGNGLAFATGIPLSTNKALDIIFKGHSSYIDGFFINNQFSCMLCGMGSDAQIAHDFANIKIRGLKTYLKLSAKHFFKARTYSFTMQVNGKSITTNAFFISIANSNQFGNRVTIAPKASVSDGLFDIVVVKKMSKLILPFSLLQQIAGINALQQMDDAVHRRNIMYFQAPRAVIINHDAAPLHIDGEPQPSTDRVELEILPKAFRLLQPSL